LTEALDQGSGSMSEENAEQAVREAAYFIWQREGCPEGCADEHWQRARAELGQPGLSPEGDEEKVMADRSDANLPALLTKDVPGG
jgi:hypothetical protein